MFIHNGCVCLEQEPLKKAKVGPLPGVTQHISGFKVNFEISKYFLLLAYQLRHMNPRLFLALDPSYPIKRLCVLECAAMFRILETSCSISRKKIIYVETTSLCCGYVLVYLIPVLMMASCTQFSLSGSPDCCVLQWHYLPSIIVSETS